MIKKILSIVTILIGLGMIIGFGIINFILAPVLSGIAFILIGLYQILN